jgi:limonene-1,2-epoxide hydrolase
MAAFIAAWPTGDATTLARFFSDDAEYHNGPLTPVQGREAIMESLATMMGMGGEVDTDIQNLVADGPVVIIERVDYWRSGEKTAGLRIAGVFEVHDRVITAWRDYFDSNEFNSQLGTD